MENSIVDAFEKQTARVSGTFKTPYSMWRQRKYDFLNKMTLNVIYCFVIRQEENV